MYSLSISALMSRERGIVGGYFLSGRNEGVEEDMSSFEAVARRRPKSGLLSSPRIPPAALESPALNAAALPESAGPVASAVCDLFMLLAVLPEAGMPEPRELFAVRVRRCRLILDAVW